MLSISATDEWRAAHPGAVIGLIELSGIDQPSSCPALEARKWEMEGSLRERYKDFSRKDFLALPVMASYDRYYSRFNKTYHVQLQLESIVLKGKNLPNVCPLVDANFIEEVDTLVLTAGHDAAKLRDPLLIDVSREGDQITQLGGTLKLIRAGDMIMRDAGGISCSILYGQDNRSPITLETTHVLYVAYAPPGVPAEAVDAHLSRIDENIRRFSPYAEVLRCHLISA